MSKIHQYSDTFRVIMGSPKDQTMYRRYTIFFPVFEKNSSTLLILYEMSQQCKTVILTFFFNRRMTSRHTAVKITVKITVANFRKNMTDFLTVVRHVIRRLKKRSKMTVWNFRKNMSVFLTVLRHVIRRFKKTVENNSWCFENIRPLFLTVVRHVVRRLK